ncbi:hypothetical protein RJ527_17435 [Thalassospiraceae bacterium LMO-SO8]|nr:hypothetical protein [Alphaproteobacteria bacterium LMO-S08]WND75797.1 hypothetical protein RJ527_17435 [Thalassospiraceae bacterium LMO-SO8]
MAMDDEIEDLVKRLVRLEKEIEGKLEAQRETLQYRVEAGRAVFEDEVLRRHRLLKTGLVTFLRRSPLATLLVAPAVYGLIVPFLILDIGVTVFQAICYTIWRMERVKRSDYVVIDRHRLPYLNLIEKLNCLYCGYANGVIAYTREAASRTEQYWCPIKHALRVRTPHGRYRRFVDYGDTRDFRERLDALRREVMSPPPSS